MDTRHSFEVKERSAWEKARYVPASQSSSPEPLAELQMLPNYRMDPLFRATVEATEEAIVNAMVAAETMTGRDGYTVVALWHDQLREVLKKYNSLLE